MTGVLIRRGNTETDAGQTPCNNGGRDCSCKLRAAKDHRKPPEARSGARKDSPLRFQKEHGPADSLISDF